MDGDLQEWTTFPKFKNQNSTNDEFLRNCLKQMDVKLKSVRPKIRSTTANFQIHLEEKTA